VVSLRSAILKDKIETFLNLSFGIRHSLFVNHLFRVSSTIKLAVFLQTAGLTPVADPVWRKAAAGNTDGKCYHPYHPFLRAGSSVVGQVAPQALRDNLRVVSDKIYQGTRFTRTLTYLRPSRMC
jgi:hypothetical protein